MSESLRNDGRVWVPKTPGDTRRPEQIPESERDYYLERKYPSFGNLVPRDVASRNAKARVRRRARRWRDRARGVSRLRRCHLAAGRRDDQGALRQPVRHVQADHRRGPVHGADADLPRHPLHDGWALGRLQPDEQPAGPARARRGQLQRPRREPPGRQRAHAGARRRLLHHPLHDRRLPRGHVAAGRSRPITTASGKRPRPRRSGSRGCSRSRDAGPSATSIARPGPCSGTRSGMSRTDGSLREAISEDPRAARGVLAERRGAGRRDQPEPRARLRRPRGRLPRVRRAARRSTRCTGPRAAAATSARRARPPKAKRCATTSGSRTSPPGSSPASSEPPVLHREELVWENVHPTQRSYK